MIAFLKLGSISINFCYLAIILSVNGKGKILINYLDTKMYVVNINMCAKFRPINYNRVRARYFKIRFFYDFLFFSTKTRKPKI